MSMIYKGLINNTIKKLQSSLGKSRPLIPIKINGQKETALFDTGASVTCMNEKTFRKIFPPGERPKKIRESIGIKAASGDPLLSAGVFNVVFEIMDKKIEQETVVFTNLKTNVILGDNLMHKSGLSYDAGQRAFYYSDRKTWEVSAIQLNEKVTLDPMSNLVVAVNAITSNNLRIGATTDAIAFVRSHEHLISGGPSLIKINKCGQAVVEIFNCTAQPITIEEGAQIGYFERMDQEDFVHVLDPENLTYLAETKKTKAPTVISEAKKKYIQLNAKLTVPEEYKDKYLELLYKHHEVISEHKYDLGRCETFKHDIQLKDNEPVYIKQFRIPEAQRKYVEDYVKELLKLGVVRPTRSKYNSPLFLVKKKDGGMRIVQDFRALNEKTMVDKYSMRDVQECIDEIGRQGSTIFTTIDLTSGFWQMALDPSCQSFTAFTLPGVGQFEWTVASMGTLGAPGSFQRLMELVIHNLKNVIAYIDDLLIHTKNHEDHLERLDQLFTRLKQHNLKINIQKSHFGCKEVSYLGFRLTPNGIKPGVDKLKAVKEALPPSDVHEVRQFLGLCNFFRGHVKNFAQISAPLNALTRKDSEWKRGPLPPDASKAFQELKYILVSEPVVHYPTPELDYVLLTDACQGDGKKPGGYGAILAQVLPNGEHQVISYASRKLKDHEKNYAPFLLEMSAAVWAMEHYSVYLKGRPFTLFTDHKPLETLGKVHTKTLNRMQEAFSEFDFKIVYKKGSEMPADFLSRNVVELLDYEHSEWVEKQNSEEWIKQVKDFMLNKVKPSNEIATRLMNNHYWLKRFYVSEDLLWTRVPVQGEAAERVAIVLPQSEVQAVLKDGHGSVFSGHEGMLKTKMRLLQQYWWPNMDRDISDFLNSCQKCQIRRKDDHPKPLLTTPLPQCTEPNQRIHADLFGGLKNSPNNKKFILCMTDAFTKYVELVAIPNKEAETVADAIYSYWICRYGVPVELITDQGKEFCNKLSSELFELMKLKHHKTTAYHPQCNAQAEVANKTIAKYLASFVDSSTFDWEQYIPSLMFAYNTSFHRTIQTTPFFLTYGQHARQPAFSQEDLQRKHYGESSAAEKFRILQSSRQLAWRNSFEAQEKTREYHDQQAQPHDFQKGQLVWLKNENFLHVNQKLAPKYLGPYRIEGFKTHNCVVLKVKNRHNLLANAARLKPYHSDSMFPSTTEEGPSFSKQGRDEDLVSPPDVSPPLTDEPPKKKRGRPPKVRIEEPEPEPEPEQQPEQEEEEEQEEDQWSVFRPPAAVIKGGATARAQASREADAASSAASSVRSGPSSRASSRRSSISSSIPPSPHHFTESEAETEVTFEEIGFGKRIRHLIKLKEEAAREEVRLEHLINSQKEKEEEGEVNLLRPTETLPKSWTEPRRQLRNLIKNNRSQMTRRFPGWSDNEIINWHMTGDINISAGPLDWHSLDEAEFWESTLAQSNARNILRNPPPAPAPAAAAPAPPAVEPGPVAAAPAPAAPAAAVNPFATLKTSEAPKKPAPYNVANVRPELQGASFTAGSAQPNLNADEKAYLRHQFFRNQPSGREIVQDDAGRPTRHNPGGLRTFLSRKT